MGAGLQTGKTVATIAPSKHAYTKDYLEELAYKQVERWQRPLLTCMLPPRINKRIWLTNR
jgi:hypothetical protein